MAPPAPAPPVRTRTCGCISTPRRKCTHCNPARRNFLACSKKCLDKHYDEEHREIALGPPRVLVAAEMADINRKRIGADAYAAHRDRLTRLLRAVARSEGLCVLGAGNCYDLDLESLVREFGEVHLVDIDQDALAAAVARQPERTAKRIIVHGNVDIGGALDQLDAWGDRLPASDEVESVARQTAERVFETVGRTFDVVVSACLLTQLYIPFQEACVLRNDEWHRLFRAIDVIHMRVMLTLLRAGGTGALVTDVFSSRAEPEIFETARAAGDDGPKLVEQHIDKGQSVVNPDKARLLAMARLPGLGETPERARLVDPWLWDAEGVVALVYALLFNRPEPES